jgi:uncharacterized protein (TIGR03086 family)
VDDVVARFQKAANCVDETLHAISSDEVWKRPTPCSEWDVRALAHHVVYELAWLPPLVEGKTIAEVGDAFDGDLLGSDPLGAFHHHCNAAHRALEAPGALEQTVHLSFGDFTGGQYADQIAGDLLIHAWDLARGVGTDDALPEELVTWAMTWAPEVTQMMRGGGVVADAVPVPDQADEQTKLLALFGRAR